MRVAFVMVLAGVVSACKADPNADVCAHYAKLAVQCREDKATSEAVLSDTADNFCKKGMSGDHEDLFGPKYRTMIECTRTATTCAQYKACEEP